MKEKKSGAQNPQLEDVLKFYFPKRRDASNFSMTGDPSSHKNGKAKFVFMWGFIRFSEAK